MMAEIPIAQPVTIPCPTCEYDLRGLTNSRCPECGSEFESFEAMVQASLHARRLFVRVIKWRQRLAIFTLAALLAIIGTSAWTMKIGRVTPIAIIGVWLLWPLAGLFAIVLLIQVIRWRFHPLIPRRQRVELNGSIPWLLFLTLPLMISIWVLIEAFF